MTDYLLAIDQGTTNSRAIIFNKESVIISKHDITLTQFYPQVGWVEQDPDEMFSNTVTCCRKVLEKSQISPEKIAAIGISNQRETTIIWDKHTGKPIYPAIVWQDRRTSELCRQLEKASLGKEIIKKTGLLFDPYFSATKIVWLLENVDQARERAERGELLFGTVDTYLLWKLTGGKSHYTDATNAARTMLFNLHTQKWDEDILKFFNIPSALLPTVLDNTADFGEMDASILGTTIPIRGMAGDQQAAAFGQACFQTGMMKVTYGTGCFMLLNTGEKLIQSNNRLLSTIAYRINNKVNFGLEGSIFAAGITIKWLRDKLKIINSAEETEKLANSVTSSDGVYLIPAFTGLGAPYWDANARGAILGLTLGTDVAHIVRAALESMAYQTLDLLNAMSTDYGAHLKTLHVDGGMVANNWLLQFIADIVNLNVERPVCIETTALGVAYFAGLQIGMYRSLDEISKNWKLDKTFHPTMEAKTREELYQGWKKAIVKVC